MASVAPVVPVKLKERDKGKGMGKRKGTAGASRSAENIEQKCSPPCLLDVEELRQDGGQEVSAREEDTSVRVEEPDCLPSPRSARVSLQGMFLPPKVTWPPGLLYSSVVITLPNISVRFDLTVKSDLASTETPVCERSVFRFGKLERSLEVN